MTRCLSLPLLILTISLTLPAIICLSPILPPSPWLSSLSKKILPQGAPTPAFYHSTDALLTTLRNLTTTCGHAHAQWAVVTETLPASLWRFFTRHPPHQAQGRILVITLTHNAKTHARAHLLGSHRNNRLRLVAVFGEHGRERISSELALSLVRRYCTPHLPPRLRRELQRSEFVLLPLVNGAGRRSVEAGDTCHRLNAARVDLNRNYLLEWGRRDPSTSLQEERAGPMPLSEFETRAVDAVVRRVQPRAYLTVHSGDRAILIPWDSGRAVGGFIQDVARRIALKHCRDCKVGSASALFGYRAYGSGVDHMLGVREVPFACTLEIFGREDKICDRMFNPATMSDFNDVMRNWSGVLETVAREVRGEDRNGGRIGWFESGLLGRGYRVQFVPDGVPLERSAEVEDIEHAEGSFLLGVFIVSAFSLMALVAKRGMRRFGRKVLSGSATEGTSHSGRRMTAKVDTSAIRKRTVVVTV